MDIDIHKVERFLLLKESLKMKEELIVRLMYLGVYMSLDYIKKNGN